jgi:hypothetical protein
VIDRLNQADAADLKEIVHIFFTVGKALHQTQHQPQISVDQLAPSDLIPLAHP